MNKLTKAVSIGVLVGITMFGSGCDGLTSMMSGGSSSYKNTMSGSMAGTLEESDIRTRADELRTLGGKDNLINAADRYDSINARFELRGTVKELVNLTEDLTFFRKYGLCNSSNSSNPASYQK